MIMKCFATIPTAAFVLTLVRSSYEVFAFQSNCNLTGVRKRNSNANELLYMSPEHHMATPSLATKKTQSLFDSFDYNSHWYPVACAQDVPANEPVPAKLFNENYVLLNKAGEEGEDKFYASRQLPKHGKWREDRASAAVRVVQGIVWIHPTYTPNEALVAIDQNTLLPPPRIPEMDLPEYKTSYFVRDFPIDWTVLIENIMDPDHGYFAHASSGSSKSLDLYSADGVQNVMHVTEDFSNCGFKITSSVNAVEKLSEYNRNVRSGTEDPPHGKETRSSSSKIATATFVAPSMSYYARRDNLTSPSSFIMGYFVCPTSMGQSRLMIAMVSKGPFSIPRWLFNIVGNNFVDQDSFLLCGQHRAVLKREAEGYLEMDSDGQPNNVRKSTYVYRSPSERMCVRIGQFFDATLSRVPNRKEEVLTWYKQNAINKKLFEPWPSREKVLDRYEQHTKICPDSMALVNRCEKVIESSRMVGFVLCCMKIMISNSGGTPVRTSLRNPIMILRSGGAFAQTSLKNPIASGFGLAASRRLFSGSVSFVCNLANRITAFLLHYKAFYSILAFALLSHSIASRVKREFFFKFDDELHQKDVKHIAKNWIDL